MFQLTPARWLALSSALLTLSASAQTADAPPARTAMPASIDAAAAVPGGYRSAMEGYQPYSETKMVPWKEANDTVGKIGGWRAYAKEVAEKGPGQQGHAGHHPADAPKPAAGPAKP
ncbi:MAG: hypothetical protein V4757_02005 [Pseudomonadota bacterium]